MKRGDLKTNNNRRWERGVSGENVLYLNRLECTSIAEWKCMLRIELETMV